MLLWLNTTACSGSQADHRVAEIGVAWLARRVGAKLDPVPHLFPAVVTPPLSPGVFLAMLLLSLSWLQALGKGLTTPNLISI